MILYRQYIAYWSDFMKICTFFGHKDSPDNIYTQLVTAIEDQIVSHSVNEFLVGCNGNFDRLVASALKILKSKYPTIEYFIVLDKHPTSITQVQDAPTLYPSYLDNVPPRFKIDRRNRWMISQADTVLTYVRFPFGGAAKFAELAKRKNKNVLNLYTPE